MSLMHALRRLFSRGDVPDETRLLFESSESTRDLLRGLDNILTANEVEFKELDLEITKLEQLEQAEIARLKQGTLGGRQKRNALLYIKRLRKQMDAYEKRLRIYDRNMNLHLNLMAKVQDVDAMQLRGVEESHIDAVVLKFEENLERYDQTMHAAQVMEGTQASLTSSAEERELRALEKELLGDPEREVGPPVPATLERPSEAAPAVEAPEEVEAAAPAREAPAAPHRTAEEEAADIEAMVERDLAAGADGASAGRRRSAAEEPRRELLEE